MSNAFLSLFVNRVAIGQFTCWVTYALILFVRVPPCPPDK